MESLGTRIKRLREAKSFSQSELARRAGVKPQTIQSLESGNQQGTRSLVRIAKALGVNADFLETGKEGSAPKVADASGFSPLQMIAEVDVRGGAGMGGESILEALTDGNGNTMLGDAVKGEWQFPADYLAEVRVRPASVHIIEVYGDSMTRPDGGGLHSGDRVMVDSSDRNPTPPGIFALWDGFGVVIKRLERVPQSDPASIRLISDNPAHEAYELTGDEVNIIGRVVWFARRM